MIQHEIGSGHQAGFPLLSALIWLPALLVVLLSLARAPRYIYALAIGGGALELALSALLVARFRQGTADLQFAERFRVGFFGYHLGVDGISVFFIPIVALLTMLVVLHAQEVGKEEPWRYLRDIFALEAALIGGFATTDLLLFWVFTTLEIVPGALMIDRWGTGPRRREAARRYVTFMLISSALLLVGAVVLGRAVQHAAGAPALSFDLTDFLRAAPEGRSEARAFFLLFFALAVRVPLFPFHAWLPTVVEQGPRVGGSIFLVGIKTGAYGFLRFVLPALPAAAHRFGQVITLVGVIGIVYGALLALVQTNLRRMIAFATLSHMGIVTVGMFSLNQAGFQGSVLEMFNLGVACAGLFFVASFLRHRFGSDELARFGGLSQRVPYIGLTYLVVAMAPIGMPGTSGFNAVHLVLEAAIDAHHWPMAIANGFGTLLGAAYLFWYYQRAFLGAPQVERAEKVRDLRLRELVIAATLVGMVFGMGLLSDKMLAITGESFRALSARVEEFAPRSSTPEPGARAPQEATDGTP